MNHKELYERLKRPRYLGDGLYIEHDGYHVVLYAHNGIQRTDQVALDPYVLENFLTIINEANGANGQGDAD